MLTEICGALRNWFTQDKDKHYGTFTVTDGTIAPLNFLQDGQYFRIVGSVFNDGVHQYPSSDLTDEDFTGSVWALAIPKDLLDLVAEIEEWQTKNGEKAAGPFQSESFGGYTYTLKSNADGFGASWQSAFASRLNIWRKI